MIITAGLIGSDTCIAAGLTVHSNTPVLTLCRALVRAGHDPGARLHVLRDDTLALWISSIGEAAQLEINGRGCGFQYRTAVGTASPVRGGGPYQQSPARRTAPPEP